MNLLVLACYELRHLMDSGGKVVSLGRGVIAILYVLLCDVTPKEVFGVGQVGVRVEEILYVRCESSVV